MPSFDVVSKVQMHEVDNAVQQTSKEIGTRYDFRDTESSIERTEEGIVLRSNSEGRLEAALNVLQEKLVRRKVSLKTIDVQDAERAGGTSYRQLIKLNQGAIQKDQVRVSGQKRDTLQQAIAAMRQQDFGVELQFENYRD